MKKTFRELIKKLSFSKDPAEGFDLPVEPTIVLSSLSFSSGRSIGKVRKSNQDSLFTNITRISDHDIDREIGIFIVADGMGGHSSGELASELAIKVTSTVLIDIIKNEEIDLWDDKAIFELIKQAISQSQEAILSYEKDMGTTITLAVVIGQRAYIANLGDSRCYLVNKNVMQQITNDHSLVNRLVEIGQLKAEDARDYPQKNILYKALGVTGNISPDLFARDLFPGDQLLLCSDGLWGSVDDSIISSVLINGTSLNNRVNELIVLALNAGGPDNISCIVAELQNC